ncbi:MAG: hypothetical protein ACNA8P_11480 [Phycisphaerales bacterium]
MGCRSCDKYGCEFDPDQESPSEADIARFGRDDIACPECGAEVYHDSPLCQACGHAVTSGDLAGKSGLSTKPLLVGAVAVITMVAFIFVVI